MYLVNLATLEMDDFLYPSHGSYVDQGCFFNPPVFCWVIGWCFRGQEHIPNAPWHRLKFPPFHQGNPLRDQWKQRFQLRWMAMCLGSCRAVSVEIPKISWLCPKEKFVYPFRRGLYHIISTILWPADVIWTINSTRSGRVWILRDVYIDSANG